MAVRSLTYTTAFTLKTVLRDYSTGTERWWNTGTSAFEAYNAANIALYGIATPEGTTGRYAWTVPAALPASSAGSPYDWTTYRLAGASLAASDLPNDVNIDNLFEWDGSNFVTTGRVPAAVWDYLASAATTVGSLGKRVVDYLGGGSKVAATVASADLGAATLAASQPNFAPAKAGDAMSLTPAVLTALFSDTDTAALVTAIIARIETDLDGSDLSIQAIAVAVRNAILDRVLAGNHDTTGTPGKLLQSADVTLNTIPRVGQTYRHRQVASDSSAKSSDVVIEVPG